MTFDLDLWPTDLNINRDHLLLYDYLPTKIEDPGAKRSWVISCTRLRETDRPTDRQADGHVQSNMPLFLQRGGGGGGHKHTFVKLECPWWQQKPNLIFFSKEVTVNIKVWYACQIWSSYLLRFKSWPMLKFLDTVDGLNFVVYQFSWFSLRVWSTNSNTHEMVTFYMYYELWKKTLWPRILNSTNVSFLFIPHELVPTKIKPSTVCRSKVMVKVIRSKLW